MRSTLDVIKELDAEAKKFADLLLVVAFENTTQFIKAGDSDRLAKLNDAIGQGGEPIGMIGAVDNGTEVFIYKRVLAEHLNDEWIESFLCRVRREVACVHGANEREGWIS